MKMFTSQEMRSLVAKTTIIIAIVMMFCLSLQFKNLLPVGWDIYYHLRVTDLILNSGNLINFDPISAGGRVHNYIPGYYALLSSISSLTGLDDMIWARVLSIILAGLCVLVFARFTNFSWLGLLATAAFAFQYETLDTFIAAGMPQTVGTLMLLLFLTEQRFSWWWAIVIGITHPSSLLLLFIFEFFDQVSRLVNFSKELLVKASWRITQIFIGTIPYILWIFLLQVKTVSPTWGLTVDWSLFLEKLDVGVMLLAGLGFLAYPYTLWTLIFGALSKYSPYLPRRFLFPLGISLSLLSVEGLKRLPVKDWLKFLLLLLVVGMLVFRAVNFGNWATPVIKLEDVESDFWLKENAKGGVLAHKDLTTVGVLYFAQLPTILDGYSEGLADANERMEYVVKGLTSDDLNDLFKAGQKYKSRYVLYNEDEVKWYGVNSTKLQPLLLLFENGYAKVRLM